MGLNFHCSFSLPRRLFSVGLEPWELLRALSPMPQLKLLHADHVSEVHARSWNDLALEVCRHRASCRSASASGGGRPVGELVTSLRKSDECAAPETLRQGAYWLSQTVSFAAVARGMRFETFLPQQPRVSETLRTGMGCVAWNPYPAEILAAKSAATPSSSSLSVCSNGTAVLPSLAALLFRARSMLSARAYLHWYERFGFHSDELKQSFEGVLCILDSYAAAVK